MSHMFKTKTWYRFKVDYNFEKIKVSVQTSDIREHKVLFNKKLKGLNRGTIGFASKGKEYFLKH